MKQPDPFMTSPAFYLRWIWRTAFTLAAFCVLLETVTRLGFSRISHIESRIAVEHREALAIRRTPGKIKFLLLGNSLPLEGVAVPQLRTQIGTRAEFKRFVIEATEYLDWYYGIRRLIGQGADPDVVLLCIDPIHLKSMNTRGDYSAFYLFQTRDIPAIGKAAHYDLTKTAGLFLARYSLFYAGRQGIRNFVLNHLDDPYAEMVRKLPKPEGPTPVESDPEPLDSKRLHALRELCESHHMHFILLIPPGFGKGEVPVMRASEEARTDLLIPVHQNEFQKNQFRDGYHLNEGGARIFTNKLAVELNAYLDRLAAN